MAWRVRNLGEGVLLALDAMRASKLRSALTILGVVIGVTTVMVMASLVEGIRSQIFTTVANSSPQTFYVIRWYGFPPPNPRDLPAAVRVRPVLSEEDARAVREAPQIRYAGLWVQLQLRMEYQGIRSQGLSVFAADNSYLETQGGTLLSGRWFSNGELAGGAMVMVIEDEVARYLFGRLDPLGRVVRMDGKALTIIGVFAKPENVFDAPGQQIGGVIPYRAAVHNFQYDETNGLFITVLAAHGVSVPDAQDAATVALRRARGLHPSNPNNFDTMTQDQILDIMNQLTSAFFLVMVALSSVALLVGGIGVMAVMMVSVTDRTREIGVRKALGATRGEILWQYLVEAATLTLTGGLLGVLAGMAGGALLKMALGIQSGPPLWSAVVATTVSILIGLVFGMIPADRASRMDPVEALRYE